MVVPIALQANKLILSSETSGGIPIASIVNWQPVDPLQPVEVHTEAGACLWSSHDFGR